MPLTRSTLAFFAAATILTLAAAQAVAQPMAIPGTGIRLVAAAGTELAPAGPILLDAEGETMVVFLMGDIKSSVENTPTYRALYPRPPERISTPSLAGNLYRRTRAEDGGGWDGWFLAVVRGEKVLSVMASYTGTASAAFDRLRESLLTISWDESVADPELALGVRLLPRGLRLVPGVFGWLSYNETGGIRAEPILLVQALPAPAVKVAGIFPNGCHQVLGAAFQGKPFAGPRIQEGRGIRRCEAWSTSAEKPMRYVALVRLPSGALINVMGTAAPGKFQDFLPVFRSALDELQPLPRQR